MTHAKRVHCFLLLLSMAILGRVDAERFDDLSTPDVNEGAIQLPPPGSSSAKLSPAPPPSVAPLEPNRQERGMPA